MDLKCLPLSEHVSMRSISISMTVLDTLLGKNHRYRHTWYKNVSMSKQTPAMPTGLI